MLAATCHSQSRKVNPTSQKWLAEARKTGENDNYAGKRRQPRCTWNVRVTIDVLENGEPTESFYANTRDISAGGLGMRCHKPVPLNALVRVTVDETGESVLARVALCAPAICDYRIGVEFVRESRTSVTPAAPPASGPRGTVDIRFSRLLQTSAA